MKKFLAGFLALMLLMGSAVAEGFTPNNAAVTIAGVRVAFFGQDGSYLSPMVKDGQIYAPVLGLCKALGRDVQVQGQIITVDGVPVAMFDADGNFVAPVQLNGADYVPVVLFCEAIGLPVTVQDGVAMISREAAAPVVVTPVPTAVPVYGYVPVTEANFSDFFNISTSYTESSSDYRTSSFTTTYYLTVQAATGYGLENIAANFDKFGRVAIPASGYAKVKYTDTIYRSSFKSEYDYGLAIIEKQADTRWKSFYAANYPVKSASGRLRMSSQEAESLLAGYYEKAGSSDHDTAISYYDLLVQADYKDSREKLKEVKEKKAAAEKAEAEKKAAAEKGEAEKKAKAEEEANLKKYNEAQLRADAGQYARAIEAFSALGDYRDSAARAEQLAVYVVLEKAQQLAQKGKCDEVRTMLAPYMDHPDAAALYQTAVLRGAQLVTAFNTEGWAVAIGDFREYCLLNIEGDTKTLEGSSYGNPRWQDGLMLLKNQEGYLYVDLKGDAAFRETFEKAEAFHQGKALVTKKDGTVCVIDTSGEVVGVMPEKAGRTYEEYAGENLVRFKEKDKYGLINLEGKVVVKARYTKFIKKFEFGLAVTCTYKGRNYAYSVINPKGKAVIKEGKYEIVNVLSENLIACYLPKDKKGKGHLGVINLKGKTIVEGRYENREFHRVGELILMKSMSSPTEVSWAIYDKEGTHVFGYKSDIQPLVSGDSQRVYIENHAGKVCQLSPIYNPGNHRRSLTDCRMDPQSPYIAMKKSDGWHVYDLALNLIN